MDVLEDMYIFVHGKKFLSCKTLLQLLKEGEWLDSIDEHIFQGTGTYIKRCIGSVAVLAAKDF